MAKSIVSIYVNSEILVEAQKQKINVSALCEQALREIVVGTATGQALNQIASENTAENERARDRATLKRIYQKKAVARISHSGYLKALKIFCDKYKIDIGQAVAIAEGQEP